MLNFTLSISNFLSIERANLISKNKLVFITASNRAGKTQILYFLYTFFWTLWKCQREIAVLKEKNRSKVINLFWETFHTKLKETFLLKNLTELISWNNNSCELVLTFDEFQPFIFYQTKEQQGKNIVNYDKNNDILFSIINKFSLNKSPIYVSSSGLGDYYKGIWAIRKYYSGSLIIPEPITDLLNDLFIVSSHKYDEHKGKSNFSNKDKNLLNFFEEKFQVQFFIENNTIKVREIAKKKVYTLEKAASGLKTLSWLYLILKYNLLGKILFLDSPEVNLSPEYLYLLSEFIVKLAQTREIKIFIATHSEYLLQSLYYFIAREGLNIDLWIGKIEKGQASYISYESDNFINQKQLFDHLFLSKE